MKKMTRVLALILALALCFTCMAVSVFADEEEPGVTPPSGNQEPTNPTDPDDSEDEGDGDETETPAPTPVPTSAPAPAREVKFVPDRSGHFRTSAAKISEKVKPAAVAQQSLYVDPVTNTIANLYDADGNLIPATLSSDGHFYIIPTNDGYVYIPVA